ncbi:MAG: site-specific integrase [Bacteroidetes bacterium]|nr:site-specific integrase [Bacteroidota bacterium]
MNCWYLPASITIKQELFQILNGYAWLDYSDLQMPLIEHTYQASGISTRASELSSVHGVKVRSDLPLLNEAVLKKVLQFTNWLKSKRYSDHTIDTYTDALTLFLRFHHPKAISDLTNQDVITFNTDYILKHKLSASYQNQVVNALKLFLKTIENRSMDIELIHRPKREKILPNVLSKEEVKRILNAHSNLKHKAMLSLIYSCGLRRSELLNLKITDVDSKRNLLIVRQAKGAKDRIVPLSQKTLELLRSYFIACRPKRWLFEGQAKETPYDASSLAAVLKQALEKCNITKPVTLHWLRHSYATHLLESGTDLRYIQVILGHSRSTTTEIYTHVSNNSIQKVTTPFDSL